MQWSVTNLQGGKVDFVFDLKVNFDGGSKVNLSFDLKVNSED